MEARSTSPRSVALLQAVRLPQVARVLRVARLGSAAQAVAFGAGLMSCGGKAVSVEEDRGAPADAGPATGGSLSAAPPPAAEEPPRVARPEEPPQLESPDSCRFDQTTGLWWEVKVDEPAHARSRAATYSWYDGSTGRGEVDGGVCPEGRCDTYHYALLLNDDVLCGFDDWRLPTVDELLSFPGILATDPRDELAGDTPFYWTAEEHREREAAWGVYACCGGLDAPADTSGEGLTRLVRSD